MLLNVTGACDDSCNTAFLLEAQLYQTENDKGFNYG